MLPGSGARTADQWHGVTLPMGILYERAAIRFWASVATDTAALEAEDDPVTDDQAPGEEHPRL